MTYTIDDEIYDDLTVFDGMTSDTYDKKFFVFFLKSFMNLCKENKVSDECLIHVASQVLEMREYRILEDKAELIKDLLEDYSRDMKKDILKTLSK